MSIDNLVAELVEARQSEAGARVVHRKALEALRAELRRLGIETLDAGDFIFECVRPRHYGVANKAKLEGALRRARVPTAKRAQILTECCTPVSRELVLRVKKAKAPRLA